jgi:hypothetical protein
MTQSLWNLDVYLHICLLQDNTLSQINRIHTLDTSWISFSGSNREDTRIGIDDTHIKFYFNFSTTKFSFFNLLFLWRCYPMRVMASSFLKFLDHTQRRTTVGRTPLDEWSARLRDLYLTTHNTLNTNIHAPGEIRTHDLSRRATASLGLRPRGHWNRRHRPNTFT